MEQTNLLTCDRTTCYNGADKISYGNKETCHRQWAAVSCLSDFHKQRMIAPYNPEVRTTDQTVQENEAKKEFFDIFAIQLRPRECRNPPDRRVDLNKRLSPYRYSARAATQFGSNGVRGNLAIRQIQDETSTPSWRGLPRHAGKHSPRLCRQSAHEVTRCLFAKTYLIL